jgi:hypothetical protein
MSRQHPFGPGGRYDGSHVVDVTIIHLRPEGYVFSVALLAAAGARVNGRTVPFATRGVGAVLPYLRPGGQGLNAKTVPFGTRGVGTVSTAPWMLHVGTPLPIRLE